jgi:hypothetical protein
MSRPTNCFIGQTVFKKKIACSTLFFMTGGCWKVESWVYTPKQIHV